MKSSTAAAILAFIASKASAATLGGRSAECNCCSVLGKQENLQGKIFSKDNEFYDERLASYYSANAAQAPWCMVLPESTADVSTIAKVLSDTQCPFGMRSGAHSAFAGSNGVSDGVTVDFGNMHTTTYDAETKIASIQPGSDWERVFNTLKPFGVIAVGGRASVVGVGGFTTGGGYSFHTGEEGFACDAVANFEVVLADGSVVNANIDENPDLFKSLKGGSGNIGFVTRIDQHVSEKSTMWGGLTTYELSQREPLYNAYINFVDNMPADPASQNILSCIYNANGWMLVTVLSNVNAIEAPPAFDEYLQVPNTSSSLQIGNVADLVPIFTGPTPLGLYANWMAGMVSTELDIMEFINDKQQEYVEKMRAAAPDSDFEVLVQFQPVTQEIVNHGLENGGNVLGLESVVADGPVIMWLIALTVDTPENQDIILPLALEYRDAIDAYATETGVQKDWVFLNYAMGDQNPLSHYGAENIALLKATSQKFDPNGVFQNLRKTGFKIPA